MNNLQHSLGELIFVKNVEGIDKVINALEAFQLPAPDFIAGDDYLRVIIYKHKELRNIDKHGILYNQIINDKKYKTT